MRSLPGAAYSAAISKRKVFGLPVDGQAVMLLHLNHDD